MELRHLRYFVTLADELHFARAAERLNIAPPTLTVQIQEIERTLSARLLVRTKRSVKLTSTGEIFLREARNVLAQFARADSVGRRAGRGEFGRVEIGYVGSAAYAGVLQDQINRFSHAWPGVHLHARELPMDDLPRLITEDQVDIGFVRLPMAIPPSLSLHVLLRDYFCLALPSAHRHVTEAPIRSSHLAGEPFIAPEQEAGTYQVAKRGRFTPRIVSRPGSLLAVLTQVSFGAGISIIPSVVRDVIHLPGVAFNRISGEAILSEVAAVFRSNEDSPTVRNFITQVQTTSEQRLDPTAWPHDALQRR
jgi:DNA-binding transcriptional LysR family regulator